MDADKCVSRFVRKLNDRFSGIVFNLGDFGIIIGAMLLVISESGSE